MDTGIKGRTSLVTGAGRGIGAAIAKALAAEGSLVAVCDKDLEPAQTVAAEIEAAGGKALAVAVDVSSLQDVGRGVALVASTLGPIDILVNNAGFSLDGPLTDMSEQQWDSVVDVCLKGSWAMARAVAPSMIDRKRGRVINIASRAHLGENNKSNYCAAKAGVIGLTHALAIELGRHDITVNAVAPGLIRTDRVLGLRYYEDIDRRAKLSTPIQRPGMPEDIAAAVLYLASEQAGFVTGETLHVTGGRYSST
ncbi:MAG TPA: SDR family NAD(P)-dependent oxidoreductase [Caulobacter sp.]|nr:SDR family NAD(P)-dependent oxidoreductase [Caulobacter sp.]